jgi:hypothetical protein
LIHNVEVAFESVNVCGPELTERGQPRIYFPKWFRLQPVEAALRVHSGFNETSLAQDSQVL